MKKIGILLFFRHCQIKIETEYFNRSEDNIAIKLRFTRKFKKENRKKT